MIISPMLVGESWDVQFARGVSISLIRLVGELCEMHMGYVGYACCTCPPVPPPPKGRLREGVVIAVAF
jgi:hypothetical protein